MYPCIVLAIFFTKRKHSDRVSYHSCLFAGFLDIVWYS